MGAATRSQNRRDSFDLPIVAAREGQSAAPKAPCAQLQLEEMDWLPVPENRALSACTKYEAATFRSQTVGISPPVENSVFYPNVSGFRARQRRIRAEFFATEPWDDAHESLKEVRGSNLSLPRRRHQGRSGDARML